MIYGLLRLPLRAKIPHEAVSNFQNLIERAQEVENLEKETQLAKYSRSVEHRFLAPYDKERRRCNICRRSGHTGIECRFRRFQATPPSKTIHSSTTN
ncbi:hypothetical protein WH47_11669 [Habropoda laboriosa]|uniref:CCHC-type domain-containing protein n=1 Tax=Habropoda laboriosa TaxID=597456 RepID=A0A0L7QLP8_9HYME|nr:hypothetical protein WH47_11669 [Habropoda laboriosa]